MTKKKWPTPFETSPSFEEDMNAAVDADLARQRKNYEQPRGEEGGIPAMAQVAKASKDEQYKRTPPRKRVERAKKLAITLGAQDPETAGDIAAARVKRIKLEKNLKADLKEQRQLMGIVGGNSVAYYPIEIQHPLNHKQKPYTVDCLDVIEALGMSYTEGALLKALWRRCAVRQGLYRRDSTDAENMVFFSKRVFDDVVTPKGKKA